MTKSAEIPALELQHVSFNYQKIKALDDLSLTVPGGISFGVMGPNGAGKTTLIRLLVGLIKGKSGTVKILGQPPSSKIAYSIGYMPQLTSLYSELTVAQNVDFFARIYGLRKDRKARVEEIVKLVNLWERRNDGITKLSGGMKQRVSLACAIVHDPPLLFLDEPTVGLDPELRATFWDYFRGLTRRGRTIIISSHTMDDAAHCDRLAFMRDGRIIALGSPAELKKNTGKTDISLEEAFIYYIHQGAGK